MTNAPWKAVLAIGLVIPWLTMLAGCADDGLPRVPIKGNVTVDGRALNSGSITFIPTAGSAGPKASGEVNNGAYHLDKKDGPVVGKLRVEIRANRRLAYQWDDPEDFDAKAPQVLPKNPIPPQFNDHSQLVCETQEGEVNVFDFNLKTK